VCGSRNPLYHNALSGYGVTGYDRETCWRDYRLGMIQALLISALGFAFATSTERSDDMVLAIYPASDAIRWVSLDIGDIKLGRIHRPDQSSCAGCTESNRPRDAHGLVCA
jgi:hypothetical protein